MTTVPQVVSRGPVWFDMRITLGNILTAVLILSTILLGWGRMSDQQQTIRDQQVQQQIVIDRQLALIQAMQLTQAQQSIVIQELDRRLSIVEDVDGLTSKKK